MHIEKTLLILLVTLLFSSFNADKPAYLIYDAQGNMADYEEMITKALSADIIFFGELHNNPISHWLELEITRELYSMHKEDLILAAEMFERDDQLIIDEYLAGMYESDKFEAEVKLWKNYKTDYKPLVEFARDSGLYFVASNVPRRYASMVSRKGFAVLDSVSEDAKKYIAPVPFEYDPDLKCYSDMLNMGGKMKGKVNENLPKAQALKDATMAFSIAENYLPGKVIIHYNGSYHSRNMQGIIWYLRKYTDNLKIVTLETLSQEDISFLEEDNRGVADYIFVVPTNMTNTY